MALRIEYMAIADLPAHPGNPKGHAIAGIVASIREHGFIEPAILDERTGRLLAGHGRREALTEMHAKAAGEPPRNVAIADDGSWAIAVVRGWSSRDDDEADQVVVGLNQHVIAGGWEDEVELARILERATAIKVPHDVLGFAKSEVEAILARVNASRSGDGGGTGGDPGSGRYREQYGVIVICDGEAEQQRVYEELKAAGHTCKVVTT